MENKLLDANETMKMIDEAKVKYETSKNFAENIIRFSKPVFVIPENPTNGDMIKALFPNTKSRLDEKTGITLVKWADGTSKCFKTNWWDAPYRKEG